MHTVTICKKAPLSAAFETTIVPEQFVSLVLTVIEEVSIASENRILMFVPGSPSEVPLPLTQEPSFRIYVADTVGRVEELNPSKLSL